jgi:hypothetical protein
MKKPAKYFLLVSLSILILGACSSPSQKETAQNEPEEEKIEEPAVITLTKAPSSPQFENATLTKADRTITPTEGQFKVSYSLNVENYDLRQQTSDAATRGIANSAKGQHIHFIVNNGPYAAHYMSDIDDELEPGNYVVLAFLSRSYHESLKNPGAWFIENLTIGDVEPQEADLSAPHLFYSRPKGTYTGEDTKKLMLDFYLLNTTLSPDGNKVKATINGDEFLIDEWAPYYIEGLSMGEVTIKLELVDNEGNFIEGPFNRVERTVMLQEAAM